VVTVTLAEWALLVIGFTYWLSISAIFAPIRIAFADLHPLTEQGIYCPVCTSFWVGCVMGADNVHPFSSVLIANIPLSGFAAMGLMAVALRVMTGGGNPAWEVERARGAQGDNSNDSTASSKVEGEHDG